MSSQNDIKKHATTKQGNEYLSFVYSEKRRPITNYPNQLAKKIISDLKIKSDNYLLDIGCGRGDMTNAFKKLGFKVEGVDISSECKDLLHPIKVYQENLEHDTIEERSSYYDIIFSKSLIEHLSSPLNFLFNCKKMLKPDGVIVLLTPSWMHHAFGPFYLDHTHVSPFTLQSLRDIGHLAGFKNIKINYFYQIPMTWKYPWTKVFSKIIAFLNLSYLPMHEGLIYIKLPSSINKYIRFSREVMLYAEMRL